MFAALCSQGCKYDPNETLESWIANNIPLYGSAHSATDENSEETRSENDDAFPPDSPVLSRPPTMAGATFVASKGLSDMDARLVVPNVASREKKIVQHDNMQSVKANKENEGQLLTPEGSEFLGIATKKPHFCGVQRLGYLSLAIKKTDKNENVYVRQWTRDCTKDTKPFVFDVNGKPLENPADAKGSMNVIDALKCLAFKKSQASLLAKSDEIMKLGIPPRDIFLLHFDGNPQVRN
tara:strand:- start:18212 stop:18922 length:711 start_codon:yes stop_codon:yes gene_type:complete